MIRILQNATILTCILAVSALLNYETVAKSADWLGSPLPGWLQARQAERLVDYRPATGVEPVDRLLHEGMEAVCFYRRLVS